MKANKTFYLSKLKGGNYHENDAPEAEVQPVPVGQTGVRLPLDQLQHRVHHYHGSGRRGIALHSFKIYAQENARNKEK